MCNLIRTKDLLPLLFFAIEAQKNLLSFSLGDLVFPSLFFPCRCLQEGKRRKGISGRESERANASADLMKPEALNGSRSLSLSVSLSRLSLSLSHSHNRPSVFVHYLFWRNNLAERKEGEKRAPHYYYTCTTTRGEREDRRKRAEGRHKKVTRTVHFSPHANTEKGNKEERRVLCFPPPSPPPPSCWCLSFWSVLFSFSLPCLVDPPLPVLQKR